MTGFGDPATILNRDALSLDLTLNSNQKVRNPMRTTSTIVLLLTLIVSTVCGQYSDRQYRRTGILNGNQVRTVSVDVPGYGTEIRAGMPPTPPAPVPMDVMQSLEFRSW